MPGPLEGLKLRAKVVWARKEGAATLVGMSILDAPESTVFAINKMAYDYKVCESAIAFHMPDPCKRSCTFWDLCTKSIKLK